MKNANAIFKDFLAFYDSKMFASENCKPYYCKFFCNSATVELYCGCILKKYIYILFQNVNVGIKSLAKKNDNWKEIIKKD